MLSRVADAIYWMNRYVERAESVARFVDVNLHLSLDLPRGTSADWAPIIATTGDEELFRSRHGAPGRDTAMRFLTFDREYPSSILRCLEAARENARSVREVISSEMWERLNRLYLQVREARPEEVLAAPYDFFTAVKQGAALFIGTTYLTMSHNEAWHFGRLGRLVERADKTSRIVDVKCYGLKNMTAPPEMGAVDDIQWGALLKSASALEMYRKRHGRIVPETVVAFLLFDREFPRAILHCLHAANESLRAIVGPAGATSAAGAAAAHAAAAHAAASGAAASSAAGEAGISESSAGVVMSMADASMSMSGSSMSMSGMGGLASGSMAAIPLAPMQAAPGALATLAELQMEALLRELEAHAAQPHDLLAGRLHQLLDGTQVRLNELGDAIRDSFFAPY
jgi:uncharacterized alpha-E superfamily protein